MRNVQPVLPRRSIEIFLRLLCGSFIDLYGINSSIKFLCQHQAEQTRTGTDVQDGTVFCFTAFHHSCYPCSKKTGIGAHFHGAVILMNGELFKGEHFFKITKYKEVETDKE